MELRAPGTGGPESLGSGDSPEQSSDASKKKRLGYVPLYDMSPKEERPRLFERRRSGSSHERSVRLGHDLLMREAAEAEERNPDGTSKKKKSPEVGIFGTEAHAIAPDAETQDQPQEKPDKKTEDTPSERTADAPSEQAEDTASPEPPEHAPTPQADNGGSGEGMPPKRPGTAEGSPAEGEGEGEDDRLDDAAGPAEPTLDSKPAPSAAETTRGEPGVSAASPEVSPPETGRGESFEPVAAEHDTPTAPEGRESWPDFTMPGPESHHPLIDLTEAAEMPDYSHSTRPPAETFMYAPRPETDTVSRETYEKAVDDAEYRGRKAGSRRTLFTAAAFYAIGRRGGRKRAEARFEKEQKSRDALLQKVEADRDMAEQRLSSVRVTQEQISAQLQAAIQERESFRAPGASERPVNTNEVSPAPLSVAVIPIIAKLGRRPVMLERQSNRLQYTGGDVLGRRPASLEQQLRAEVAKNLETITEDPEAEAADLPPGHRLERSAWHAVEVDEQGHAALNPTRAYGEAFHQERQQEQLRQQKQAADADREARERRLGRLARGGTGDGPQAEAEQARNGKGSLVDRTKATIGSLKNTLRAGKAATNGPSPQQTRTTVAVFLAVLLIIFLTIVTLGR